MTRDRMLAVLLLLVGFAALVSQRFFSFAADAPGALRTSVAVLGAASLLLGVWLWLRRSTERS
ncbi:hypothetical protein [Plantactinospora soyae]|uniref:Membrane-bound ClpP family serine protease n=1 Tax=Plantactinospora soyae TaxID=1544732 RepID=A0A927R321_9ACTN|nr:hypothetical protein [Plantactinospora soyae]MBE1491383.1 membrane-bound ClpP family serine protease [Plantactinospora soyae]